MKTPNPLPVLLAMVIGALGFTSALAADVPKYGLAANNRIKAQQLVNQIIISHPELVAAGMHCIAPGTGKQAIVASTLDVIGKPSDPEDVLHGNTTIEPSRKAPKLGIMLPLRDANGKDIGSLALQFKYQPGDDQVKCFATATAIRDSVARQVPDLASLFVTIP